LRNGYKVLVRRSEGKRALGRRRCKHIMQEDNIKIFINEMRWEVMDSGSVVHNMDPVNTVISRLQNSLSSSINIRLKEQ
jgi:hypothetical protein